MSALDYRAATLGEHLLQYLNEKILKPNDCLGLMSSIGRGRLLHDYAVAVNSLNLTARLIKKAGRIICIDDESVHHGEFVRFLQQTMGIVNDIDGVVDEIARRAICAAKVSRRVVSNSTKRKVRGDRVEVECYLCGNMCIHKSEDPHASIYYEHIWPRSYGGDSIEENLLPSCRACNEAKDDMILWHTGAIFSFVLKPNPSAEERTAIGRREKVARRMQDILMHAILKKCTLKEAAIQIGPAKFESLTEVDGNDAVDYFNLRFD